MSHSEKSAAYQFLKSNGVELPKHYREYKTEELVAAADELSSRLGVPLPEGVTSPPELPVARDFEREEREFVSSLDALSSKLDKLIELQLAQAQAQAAPAYTQPAQAAQPPTPAFAATMTTENRPPAAPKPTGKPTVKPLTARQAELADMAGVTSNSHAAQDDVLEIDESGNIWYQREVPKPASPRPRGRRVWRSQDSQVEQQTVKVGEYIETFEVEGDTRNLKPTEARITLPSYQTGIYRSPKFPFRIHTYNGRRAFNLFDVQTYYGAPDLVPDTIKKVYVSNDLCYDITTTIRAINDEYAKRVLRQEA